jgi:adenylosuccinate lyase
MIKRYTREAMGRVWTEEYKFQTWLQVEILVCEALAKIGQIPKKAAQNIRRKARFSLDRISAIEAETKHDVIAFLTSVGETVGPDARYIHLGLTSSDILDTAMAVRLREASKLILKKKSHDSQAHSHGRSLPRHPCRAHYLRSEAGIMV